MLAQTLRVDADELLTEVEFLFEGNVGCGLVDGERTLVQGALVE